MRAGCVQRTAAKRGIPIILAVFGVESVLLAQQSDEVTSYQKAYFSALNVMTARDMVNRIPGADAGSGQGDGGERRGLRGKTDRVLIDGKKLTGKSNDADEFLDRLPASKVVRIEVIDGMVGETESGAGARTINIITSQASGYGTWSGFVNWQPDLRSSLGGRISYSGNAGRAEYNLALESGPIDSLRIRRDDEAIAGLPVERDRELRSRNAHRHEVSGSARISVSGTRTWLLNALYLDDPRAGVDTIEFFDVRSGDGESFTGKSEEPIDRSNEVLELGGTYEHRIGDRNRFEVLFLRNERDVDRISKKTVYDSAGQVEETSLDLRDEQAGESVLRGSWYRNGFGGRDFDVGLELAVNTLDKRTELFEGDDDPVDPVFIPNADQRIREDRAELFANYSYPLSNSIVRLGLAAEFSGFDQQGSDVSLNRNLRYVKPALDISNDDGGAWRRFLTFERDVSQLDFDDFVASIDRVDREIRAGNPNLRPETSWDLSVGAEYHFRNGAGLVKGRVFHRWVSDVEDLVPLEDDDSMPGNLPRGRHWGVVFDVGIRLQALGLDGAVVNGSLTLQDSRVEDPFTGEIRQFLGKERWDAGAEFRHDIHVFNGAYGLSWSGSGRERRYDVDRIDIESEPDELQLFVEWRIGDRLLLKLQADELAEARGSRLRIEYEGGRGGGVESLRTERRSYRRRSARLTLSGSF